MKKLLGRSVKYLLIIATVCLALSTLAFFAFNKNNISFMYMTMNWSFVILIMLFCYAVLAFVTEQGFFNGIRYSTKHVRATLSKAHRRLMMDEHEVDNAQQLKEVMKQKYLYTRPKFPSTYPLMISTTILLICVSVISFKII